MLNLIATLLRDEEGASLVEYSVIIGLIAAVGVVAIKAVQFHVMDPFEQLDWDWALYGTSGGR